MNRMSFGARSRLLALSLWVAIGGCAAAPGADQPPAPALAGGQAQATIEPNSVLFVRGDEQLAAFRSQEQLVPTRTIRASSTPLALPAALQSLGTVVLEHAGTRQSVNDYLARKRVGGLLVVKNGKVVFEHYGLGNTAQTRWISFSVAKSVVSMLIGAAIQDGYIGSVEEKVTAYLPRLKDSSYQDATIADLLQMASGVAWNEDYADPNSDVASVSYETLKLYEQLRHKPRVAEPGAVFNYNTAETNLAGTLLRAAIGNNLATYAQHKIWQPFGMETDALWQLTEPGGGEFGGCCISATLRDYARIGLFAMAQGQLADGTQILPQGWMTQSIAPSKGYPGYGYFWWLNGDGSYQASGIFGQGIYINPAQNVVIAIHSAWDEADSDSEWDLLGAVYSALAAAAR